MAIVPSYVVTPTRIGGRVSPSASRDHAGFTSKDYEESRRKYAQYLVEESKIYTNNSPEDIRLMANQRLQREGLPTSDQVQIREDLSSIDMTQLERIATRAERAQRSTIDAMRRYAGNESSYMRGLSAAADESARRSQSWVEGVVGEGVGAVFDPVWLATYGVGRAAQVGRLAKWKPWKAEIAKDAIAGAGADFSTSMAQTQGDIGESLSRTGQGAAFAAGAGVAFRGLGKALGMASPDMTIPRLREQARREILSDPATRDAIQNNLEQIRSRELGRLEADVEYRPMSQSEMRQQATDMVVQPQLRKLDIELDQESKTVAMLLDKKRGDTTGAYDAYLARLDAKASDEAAFAATPKGQAIAALEQMGAEPTNLNIAKYNRLRLAREQASTNQAAADEAERLARDILGGDPGQLRRQSQWATIEENRQALTDEVAMREAAERRAAEIADDPYIYREEEKQTTLDQRRAEFDERVAEDIDSEYARAAGRFQYKTDVRQRAMEAQRQMDANLAKSAEERAQRPELYGDILAEQRAAVEQGSTFPRQVDEMQAARRAEIERGYTGDAPDSSIVEPDIELTPRGADVPESRNSALDVEAQRIQDAQGVVLGKMGVAMYGVRKAADRARAVAQQVDQIAPEPPSAFTRTGGERFASRQSATDQMLAREVPELPNARPEVQADVARREMEGRLMDDEFRIQQLKDPDVHDQIEALVERGVPYDEAEQMIVFNRYREDLRPTATGAPEPPSEPAAMGASGEQMSMFASNPKARGHTTIIPDIVNTAIESGKWAGRHAGLTARWVANAAGEAIGTMREFASIVLNQFGRGIRKFIPDIWKRYKSIAAQRSSHRMRRQRGAIDFRKAGVSKTNEQAIRASERKAMRSKATTTQREQSRMQAEASNAVREKLGSGTYDGQRLAIKAERIGTPKDAERLNKEIDLAVNKVAERDSVSNSLAAIKQSLSRDKKSGISGLAALSDKDLGDAAMVEIRALGIENPRTPTRRELAALTDEDRAQLEQVYDNLKQAYTHKSKYGARPEAEGAHPITGDRNFVNEGWASSVKRGMAHGKEAFDTLVDPVSDYVNRRAPRLLGRLRSYVTEHEMVRNDYRTMMDKTIAPARKVLRKAGKDVEMRFSSAVMRSDIDEVRRIADAIGGKDGEAVMKMFTTGRTIMNDLHRRAKEAGIDVGYLTDYWPRVVKRGRHKELRQFFSKEEENRLTQAYRQYARNKNVPVGSLTEAEKLQIAESVSKGYGPRGIGGDFANAKHRTIGDIPDEIQHLYEPYYKSIDMYIDRVSEAVARKRLFGSDVPLTGPDVRDPFHVGPDANIKTVSELEPSIGKLLAEDGVAPGEVDNMLKVVKSVFNSATSPVGSVTANARAAGYLLTMGQIRSALAQVEDLASTAVFMPGEIPSMFKAITGTLLRKNQIDTVRVGIERLGVEYAGRHGADKAVDFVFKATGLSQIDRAIKNVTLNTALIGGQKKARAIGTKKYNQFKQELTDLWGEKGADKLLDDLAKGEFSGEVATYVTHKLAGIQPVSSLDVPLGYHAAKQTFQDSQLAGAGVLSYQLKTFFLRRLGALRRNGLTGMAEGVQMMRAGQTKEGSKKLMKSLRNLIAMGTVLTAAGATRNQVVGYMYGNQSSLDDDVWDAFLSLSGVSRYAGEQALRSGQAGYAAIFAPPSLPTVMDVITDGSRMADGKMPKTLRRLPHMQTLDIFTGGQWSERLKGNAPEPNEEEAVGTTPIRF